tara:strand:+ start:364 stop:1689 length:1326 start_codon:yes stop_codon:yes gene_type:complete
MRLLFIIVLFFILNNCSFDNKTGIWNSTEKQSKKKENIFREFKSLSINEKNFNQVINLNKNYTFKIPKKITNSNWNDIYYNKNNNSINFTYNENISLLSLSKKLSIHKLSKFFLYNKGYAITSDTKGNIIVFSKNENKLLYKYNFYKKSYKKINKKLNFVLEGNIIYVTDNIGFIYAYEYKKNKIVWAKNIKIPFRSNLKIKNNKLITADEKNNIYLFDKKNGDIIKLFPTEETLIKNQFINNFSLSKDLIFALNTYGSLFAIDAETNLIKWVRNLNQSSELNQMDLFQSSPLINNEEFIIVAAQEATYIIAIDTGIILNKFNISSVVKPIIVDKNLFLISKNNLLICIDILSGEVLYSYNINQKIAEYYNIKKQKTDFKEMNLVNDNIFILLKNSFVIEFELSGNLKKIFKLPKNVYSNLIFAENLILYLNRNKKLVVLD